MPTFNFAGVPDQKEFTPLPAGVYELELNDYREGVVKGEGSKHKGATMYNFTWEVVDNDEEKYNGRKIFDNLTIVEDAMWRLKAMLKAFGCDVPQDGDIDVEFDDFIGERLTARVGVQKARKVGDQEYEARNTIKRFEIKDEAAVAK